MEQVVIAVYRGREIERVTERKAEGREWYSSLQV
jgi:hypothetical protein